MRSRRTLILAGLLTSLWLPAATRAGDNTELLHNLNACIDSRFDGNDAAAINESFQLDSVCPALAQQYASHPELQTLQPPLGIHTSLNQLLDIRALLQHQQRIARHSARPVDHDYLQGLRDTLEFTSNVEEPGLWQQFIHWLKTKYKPKENEESTIQWLLDLLEGKSIPDWLGKAIFYTSMAAIILLALFIVITELRAARRPGARRRRLQRQQGGQWADDLPVLESLSWEQIARLPIKHQPGAILRFVIDYCIEQGWLTENRSRTNREMWRELRRTHANIATGFNTAVNLSEQAIYGDHVLDEGQLRELYTTAQHLTGGEDKK